MSIEFCAVNSTVLEQLYMGDLCNNIGLVLAYLLNGARSLHCLAITSSILSPVHVGHAYIPLDLFVRMWGWYHPK